jgi:hypothetical protein
VNRKEKTIIEKKGGDKRQKDSFSVRRESNYLTIQELKDVEANVVLDCRYHDDGGWMRARGCSHRSASC